MSAVRSRINNSPRRVPIDLLNTDCSLVPVGVGIGVDYGIVLLEYDRHTAVLTRAGLFA